MTSPGSHLHQVRFQMSRVALVQTQVLMETPVPNMAKRLIFSTSRLGRFLISQSGMGLLVCVAMVTLASHLRGQTQDGGHKEGDTQRYPTALQSGDMVVTLVGDMGLSTLQRPLLNSRCWDATSVPLALLSPSHSQDVFPKAALPLRLVEEVIEVAAKSDEDEAEGQEAKDAWKRSGTSLV